MTTIVTAKYADGTDARAVVLPIHTILAERKFGEKLRSHQIEGSAFVCWVALGSPGQSFDGWLAGVVDLDQREEDVDASSNGDTPTPTQPGPLAADSSSSA